MGIAHHLGWAVAVTASAGSEVVDRRRIELIEPGGLAAPAEHEARYLDDDAAVKVVAAARASALRAASASLGQLAAALDPGRAELIFQLPAIHRSRAIIAGLRRLGPVYVRRRKHR